MRKTWHSFHRDRVISVTNKCPDDVPGLGIVSLDPKVPTNCGWSVLRTCVRRKALYAVFVINVVLATHCWVGIGDMKVATFSRVLW